MKNINEIYEEINDYLTNDNRFNVNRTADSVWYVTFNRRTKYYEKLVVQVSVCDTPEVWIKKRKGELRGRVGEHFISLQTYAYDKEGNCIGYYNPQNKVGSTDMNWIKDAGVDGVQELLDEVERQAFWVNKGKSYEKE